MIVPLLTAAIVVFVLFYRDEYVKPVLFVSFAVSLATVVFSEVFAANGITYLKMAGVYLAFSCGAALFVIPGDSSFQWTLIIRYTLGAALLAFFAASPVCFFDESSLSIVNKVKTAHLMLLSACMALAFSTGGAAYALWLQDHYLKTRRSNNSGSLVPSVMVSDLACFRLVGATFILLTFAILPALFMIRNSWSNWLWEPRSTGGFILWLSYGLAFHLRKTGKLRGVSFALWPFLSVVLFVLVAILGLGYRGGL